MEVQPQIRLSTRIPTALFVRLEDERHRRTRASGRRVSARALIVSALELLLANEVQR